MTALLAVSTSLVTLNVEGCHRLYGAPACPPPGFDSRGGGVRRPGVICRLPPPDTAAAESAAIASGGKEVASAASEAAAGGCKAALAASGVGDTTPAADSCSSQA